MDRKALRNAGLGAGGLCLAAALGVAVTQRTDAPLPQPRPAPTAPAPSAADVRASPAAPIITPLPEAPQPPAVEPSNAPQPAPVQGAKVSFLVRFTDDHPLARAQALEAQGRRAEAAQAARAGLRRTRALRGLCFQRFTAGGYEIVLESCNQIAASDQDAYVERWTAALSGLDGVEYAEPNAIAQPDRAAQKL
ncbi:MAG: hypothetical protein NW203_03140 [Hyphomonadaceae bacterium]|nr:hypothetical protein [Hyphomonadaceae bacterium]